MDEELKAYLDGMMTQINDKFERTIDQITALRADFQNTRGFLLEDSIIAGRRMMSVEDRLAAIEKRLGL